MLELACAGLLRILRIQDPLRVPGTIHPENTPSLRHFSAMKLH